MFYWKFYAVFFNLFCNECEKDKGQKVGEFPDKSFYKRVLALLWFQSGSNIDPKFLAYFPAPFFS